MSREEHVQLAARGNPFFVVDDQISHWINLYRRFGIELSKREIQAVIPPPKAGFNRLVVVAEGLTLEYVFNKLPFPTDWRTKTDNDFVHMVNDREPTHTYAVWVRDRREADEENKNLSADDLKKEGHQGITLLERMLLELSYFEETGEHMDISYITLCSGSRHAHGNVPDAVWLGSRFHVNWNGSSDAYSDLRSRSVIS